VRFRLALLCSAIFLARSFRTRGRPKVAEQTSHRSSRRGQLAGGRAVATLTDLTTENRRLADRREQDAMQVDNLFGLHRWTKPMTATGTHDARGPRRRCRLDGSVEKYLPEVQKHVASRSSRYKEHILLKKPGPRRPTVRDCLRHTSGMPFGS